MKTFGEKLNHLEYVLREGCYAVIIDSSKRQVAVIRTANGNYFLPGGGMDKGEAPEECLRREMLEETGYLIEIVSFIGKAQQYFITSKNESIVNKGIFFLAQLTDKIQAPTEADHDLIWIQTAEVDQLIYHEHQC